LPELNTMRNVSFVIAQAVAKQARAEGLTEPYSDEQIEALIRAKVWQAEYRPYAKAAA
jgi:malate dehydrogenase (oxaloacetate-decarboxylating)